MSETLKETLKPKHMTQETVDSKHDVLEDVKKMLNEKGIQFVLVASSGTPFVDEDGEKAVEALVFSGINLHSEGGCFNPEGSIKKDATSEEICVSITLMKAMREVLTDRLQHLKSGIMMLELKSFLTAD